MPINEPVNSWQNIAQMLRDRDEKKKRKKNTKNGGKRKVK